ncbi:MAG: peptide chain release factor 2 [Clostridiales bacterium]|nr:peptide chain release factor 2 [Clostridiales bacterium]
MIELQQYSQQLDALRATLSEVGDGLHIDHMEEELQELREEMNADGFWDNVERSTHVNRRISSMEGKIKHYNGLVASCDDIETMMELAEEENDTSMVEEIAVELEKLQKATDALALETLMRGKYDDNDAVLSLHAGAGGTEAQDWTSMLYRMYTRYCERMGFEVKLLDLLDGDEAGIKSVTFEVSGDHAYGYLRGEKGVHRLVRISPFDANARRHTSFASLDVAPMLEDDDSEIEIDMKYVRVDTYHSSGAGGQNVNKTSSAVRMTYVKDDVTIVVSCQTERDQVQNRATCIKMLKAKLLELRERSKEQEMADIKGEMKKIEWGSQIRSYVFQPYTMVKDHRTGFESGNIDDVMDGNLEGFTTSYLKMQ